MLRKSVKEFMKRFQTERKQDTSHRYTVAVSGHKVVPVGAQGILRADADSSQEQIYVET